VALVEFGAITVVPIALLGGRLLKAVPGRQTYARPVIFRRDYHLVAGPNRRISAELGMKLTELCRTAYLARGLELRSRACKKLSP
jgi:hypothetical protein